jgi:glutaredoxin
MNSITQSTAVKVYRMSTPDHNCPWGLRAINLLTEKGITFEDIPLTSAEEVTRFKTQYDVTTTPQIFFGESRIGGYTDLAQYLDVKAEKADYSYTPVLAVFGTATLMAIATASGFSGLMGISLSMLASLKLMDINTFVESFAKYDLITQRFKPYGRVYPFAELLIGLGFLSKIAPLGTGVGSLLIGLSGAISVFKAIYIDKMALNCACVGGHSKVPLGVISFTENAIMALMGVMLIFSSMSSQEAQSFRELKPTPPAIVQLQ